MNKEPSFGIDTSVFHEVIDNGSSAARLRLADQLAEFCGNENSAESEIAEIVPVILKLAMDPTTEVRRRLAARLSKVKRLHADIVFTIISDDDDIALPFLAETPALNHWHMLAILRVGDLARQISVALRPDISTEALAHIIASSTIEVCLALFDNRCVLLDERDYHVLYERFGQSPVMAEKLLACPDLPLDIRIMQAKRASNRMHQLMAERGWVAANDAANIVADAEDTAILRILVEANEAELADVVTFLAAKSMLTPSIIVRAACLGEMRVVVRSVAHLAGVTAQRAHEVMIKRGPGGFKSLHSRSGLPQSCYGILQAACDVARDASEEGIELGAESFGRRMIEALMTRYDGVAHRERAKHLEFMGRFAEDRVKIIAKRLKADFVRAA